MPSRRRLLRSVGTTIFAGSLAGCLSDLGLAKTGHLQLKSVSLQWSHDGQNYRDEPLRVLYDIDEQKIRGRYEPRFFGEGIQPLDVTVGEEVHDRLARRFEVRYLIGVCGPDFARGDESYGCRNTWTSREDFNRVQLNDRAEVRLSDHEFDVIDVYEDANEVRTTSVQPFDFLGLHEDDGLEPERW